MRFPNLPACGVLLLLTGVAVSGEQQFRSAEGASRPATPAEMRAAIGGIKCMACEVVGTGNCPGGAVPNPEKECKSQTAAGCLVAECWNCAAAAGTKYKRCIPNAAFCCDANIGDDGVFIRSRACGVATYAGCQPTVVQNPPINPLTGLGASTSLICVCPGGYVNSSWYVCGLGNCQDASGWFCP